MSKRLTRLSGMCRSLFFPNSAGPLPGPKIWKGSHGAMEVVREAGDALPHVRRARGVRTPPSQPVVVPALDLSFCQLATCQLPTGATAGP
eukprot:15468624-Alexandrium_andersonii.AAC.1